jgi:hypothetical protein
MIHTKPSEKKKVLPQPGQKLSATDAREKAIKQYGKALAMLAK